MATQTARLHLFLQSTCHGTSWLPANRPTPSMSLPQHFPHSSGVRRLYIRLPVHQAAKFFTSSDFPILLSHWLGLRKLLSSHWLGFRKLHLHVARQLPSLLSNRLIDPAPRHSSFSARSVFIGPHPRTHRFSLAHPLASLSVDGPYSFVRCHRDLPPFYAQRVSRKHHPSTRFPIATRSRPVSQSDNNPHAPRCRSDDPARRSTPLRCSTTSIALETGSRSLPQQQLHERLTASQLRPLNPHRATASTLPQHSDPQQRHGQPGQLQQLNTAAPAIHLPVSSQLNHSDRPQHARLSSPSSPQHDNEPALSRATKAFCLELY